MPCGHLLGKGLPLGSRLWCIIVSLSLFPLVSLVRYLIVLIPYLCTLTLFDIKVFYFQRWPSRYFTCKSGNVICIDQEIRCDCDCEDGSDETAKWAVCAQEIIYYCEHNSVKYENDYTCVLLPYYTLKCQSRLQQATNFATSCLTFEKNKV